MIPAMIHELTDTQALECQLEENTKRGDLHPLEEAAGYHALLAKKHGYTVAKIAERTGKSVKYIYDRIKLLELRKEAQELFLADRITAGHAILLARLSPKDQGRAIDPEINRGYGSHGIWQGEHALFDGDDDAREKDPYAGLKPVSVREFEAWIDRTIRFDRKLIEPVLYPETAKRVEEAEATKLKVVPITRDHGLSPDLKGDERTVCCYSWKRADGLDGTKTCEHAILGVIVVGHGRGQAFDVCIAKEKCKTHWSKEINARKRTATQREKGGAASKPSWQIEEERRQAKHAQEELERQRWIKATPAILDELAAKILYSESTAGQHVTLGDLIIRQIASHRRHLKIPGGGGVDRGTNLPRLVSHIAWLLLSDVAYDNWQGPRDFPKIAKHLGIDLKKLLDEHAPVDKPAAPKKGARKGTPGVCRECGCTDDNCEQCVEATGEPCTWVEPDLCSACAPANVPATAKKTTRKTA